MSIGIVAEVWKAIKTEIDDANLPDAAESLVTVLIDNDYEADEIKSEFRRDSHVMDALKSHTSLQEEEEEDEDYDYDEDSYDENW